MALLDADYWVIEPLTGFGRQVSLIVSALNLRRSEFPEQRCCVGVVEFLGDCRLNDPWIWTEIKHEVAVLILSHKVSS